MQVVVATPYSVSQRLMERYVGGILKGIASVRAASVDGFDPFGCDLVAVYAESPTEWEFRRKYREIEIVGIKFTVQASGLRVLTQLPRDATVGVVADHHQCANMLLREILECGVFDPHFVSGSFDDMAKMPADVFAVSEEMDATLWSKYSGPRERVVILPRSLSAASVADVIGAVVRVQHEKTRG